MPRLVASCHLPYPLTRMAFDTPGFATTPVLLCCSLASCCLIGIRSCTNIGAGRCTAGPSVFGRVESMDLQPRLFVKIRASQLRCRDYFYMHTVLAPQ